MGVIISQTGSSIDFVTSGGNPDTKNARITWDETAQAFKFFADTGVVVAQFTAVASATNQIVLTPSATDVEPSITAIGSDADVSILLTPKGTGVTTVTAGGFTVTAGDVLVSSGDLTLTSGDTILTSGNLTLTSGDATLTSGNLTVSSGTFDVTGNSTLTGTCDVTGALTADTVVGGSVIVSIADATDTLALTAETHGNRTLLVLDATLDITLPEATGTGDRYKVVQGIAATSSTIVTADTANAEFRGMLNAFDTDDEATLTSWPAVAGDDTITFDGVATGGKIYDWVEFEDIATDVWLVRGQISQSGGSEVTPFSSAA